MKPQEIFDSVVRHLNTQKRRAVRQHKDHNPSCVMRNRTGTLKCAIGHFLTKEQAVLFDPGPNNVTDSSAEAVAYLIRRHNEDGIETIQEVYGKLKDSQISAIKSLPDFLRSEEDLLERLQAVHDSENNWNSKGFTGNSELLKIAEDWDFSTEVLNQYLQ